VQSGQILFIIIHSNHSSHRGRYQSKARTRLPISD